MLPGSNSVLHPLIHKTLPGKREVLLPRHSERKSGVKVLQEFRVRPIIRSKCRCNIVLPL